MSLVRRLWSADGISAICLLAISVWYGTSALELDSGMGSGIGPGYFPLLLAIALGVLAVLTLVRPTPRSHPADAGESEEDQPSAPSVSKALWTVGLLAAMLVAWEIVGNFYVSLAVFLASLLAVYFWEDMSVRRAVKIAGFVVVLVASVYLLFVYVFGFRL